MDPSKQTGLQPQQPQPAFTGFNFMSGASNQPNLAAPAGVAATGAGGFTFGTGAASLAPKTTATTLNFAGPTKTSSFPPLGAGTTTAATGLSFPNFSMSPSSTPSNLTQTGPPQTTQMMPMFNPPAPTTAASTPQLSTGFKPPQQIQAVSAAGPPVAGFGLSLGTKPATGVGGGTSLGGGLMPPSSTPLSILKLTPTTTVGIAPTLSSALTGAATSSVPTLSLGASSLLSQPSTQTPAATSTSVLGGLGALPATSTPTLAASLGGTQVQPPTTTASVSAQPAVGPAMTFAQLEDMINKWTIELGEQERQFLNQATQINAWDNLLNANCIKLTTLHNTVEEVKTQQKKINCDLDFILAQQNELDACLAPLEKEYTSSIYTNDVQREKMYFMAENIDSQLKRMSEDLKETIEHINETSRSQETVDPVLQIGRILNAHMNSLQWIDDQTSKLQTEFESLNKIHENFKREIDRQYTTFY